MTMFYVYILEDDNKRTYVGTTADLSRRIKEHNEGRSRYTKRSAGEWTLKWFCAFLTKAKAADFERYLKTGSGIAFFRKRFI